MNYSIQVSHDDDASSPSTEEPVGMAGALMKALQDRQKHIQSSGEMQLHFPPSFASTFSSILLISGIEKSF